VAAARTRVPEPEEELARMGGPAAAPATASHRRPRLCFSSSSQSQPPDWAASFSWANKVRSISVSSLLAIRCLSRLGSTERPSAAENATAEDLVPHDGARRPPPANLSPAMEEVGVEVPLPMEKLPIEPSR
jgi:hypothetical protein